MTINTETIRDAAEVLDTLTSALAADHPLRTRAAARAKSCVSGLYSAADALDAQSAEIAAMTQHANFLNTEIVRLREALRKIESVGGDATSGDGHARCKQIARAALSGESKC